MSTSFAPGAACAPCNDNGHFCQAQTYDDHMHPACYHCADGVKCAHKPKRNSFPKAGQRVSTAPKVKPITSKQRDPLPTKHEAAKAIALHEETMTQIVGKIEFNDPNFRANQQLGGTRFTPAPAIKKLASVRADDYEVIDLHAIPTSSKPNRYAELVARLQAMPEGKALQRDFGTTKAGYRFVIALRRHIGASAIEISYKQSGGWVYFWRGPKDLLKKNLYTSQQV